jgi:hypothetical protein
MVTIQNQPGIRDVVPVSAMLRIVFYGCSQKLNMQRIAGTLQELVWRSVTSAAILLRMFTRIKILLLGIVLLFSLLAFNQSAGAPSTQPQYTSDGQLKLPDQYRSWVYLTTGFDMSYNPALQMSDHHMFDNVFVNPEAYKAFLETGTWPDKTLLVLEARGAEGKGSINQRGNYQGTDVMAIEVHVKDEARFPGKWAFFGFAGGSAGGRTTKMIPLSADCYSCHAQHGAVDTTFVQFYPTILSIAKQKGTLTAAYQKETSAQK